MTIVFNSTEISIKDPANAASISSLRSSIYRGSKGVDKLETV